MNIKDLIHLKKIDLNFLFPPLFKSKARFGPHTVMIDIEDECNLKCRMCFYHSPFIEEKFQSQFTRMELSTFKKLMAELQNLRVRKITLCGKGEPFLYPEIKEIIKIIKSQNLYLNIFTNGIHINEELLDALLEFKVNRLTFSIHAGDSQTYFKVHPQADEDAFARIEKTLHKINDFRRNKGISFPYLKFVFVLYKDNYKNVREMIEFAEKHKADEILFKPLQVYPEQEELALQLKEVKDLISRLRNLKIKLKNNLNDYLHFLNSQLEHRYSVRVKSQAGLSKKRRCFIPWYQSVIMTNGDVVFCSYNQIKIGNINEKRFSDIWFSQAYKNLRKELPCGECPGIGVYPFLRYFQKIFSSL